jgi:RNA polymerase subunit RPABC4/transcription elongation factor Spt4
MASNVCPTCKNLLCVTATNCPNCGHVPVLVSIRKFLLVVIVASWAVVAQYGEKAGISQIAAFALDFAVFCLIPLLMMQLRDSIFTRFK